MKRSDWKENYVLSCSVFSLLLVISSLVNIFVSMINHQNISIIDMVNLGINIIFFCFIGLYFYKARGGNYGFALYATLAYTISEYLIPLILYLIQGLLTFSFSLVSLISIFGVGVAFTIILILESRNHKKGLIIALKVLGIILAVLNGMFYIGLTAMEIEAIVVNGLYETADTTFIITSVAWFFSNVVSVIFSILIGIFPFYLNKMRSN